MQAELIGQVLHVTFDLKDPEQKISLDVKKKAFGRRDQLWKTTCFEFFLAMKKTKAYWEFHLAPTGDWNVYFLEDYRTNLKEEKRIVSRFPCVFDRSKNGLIVKMQIEGNRLGIQDWSEALAMASVVLKDRSGQCTYWAPEHPKDKADFHDRKHYAALKK